MRVALHFAAIIFAIGLGPAAMAKDAYCVSAEAQVALMSAKLPIEVDAVTKTVSAEASCDAKQVRLTRVVDLELWRMEADFKDFLQKQDNEMVCADKNRRSLIDGGWQWGVEYRFKGGEVQIVVSCG